MLEEYPNTVSFLETLIDDTREVTKSIILSTIYRPAIESMRIASEEIVGDDRDILLEELKDSIETLYDSLNRSDLSDVEVRLDVLDLFKNSINRNFKVNIVDKPIRITHPQQCMIFYYLEKSKLVRNVSAYKTSTGAFEIISALMGMKHPKNTQKHLYAMLNGSKDDPGNRKNFDMVLEIFKNAGELDVVKEIERDRDSYILRSNEY